MRELRILAEAYLQITFDLPFSLERLAQSQKKREERRVFFVSETWVGFLYVDSSIFCSGQKSKVDMMRTYLCSVARASALAATDRKRGYRRLLVSEVEGGVWGE